MAKGNDGNYLQHCIEVEAAVRLAQMDSKGRLHIALTHGMAPFEGFNKPKPYQRRELLENALDTSTSLPQSNEPEILSAYRKTKASRKQYPNSAELLRVVIGADKLSGGITEVDCEKHEKLVDAWVGSSVVSIQASWREQVGSGGNLACPNDLQRPWLFSMDPMTYSENGREDDEQLHRCDIDSLSNALSQYVRSGQPGIATLFVYSVGVQDDAQRKFWKFVDDLAERISVDTYSYWVPHQGGNLNLAGLFYSGIELSTGFNPPYLNIGRADMKSSRT